MDRSFLSDPAVIEASRQFVCVRLMSYENEAEADFLKSFRVTRSGELENTVFAVLSPDGKERLAQASRSARQTFGDASHMAEAMKRVAAQYPGKVINGAPASELPAVANVRLALDVAACDNRPLVVLVAPDEPTRRKLESQLARLAWDDKFIGRFTFVVTADLKDLSPIEGVKPEPGVFVVQPDKFGLKGTVVAHFGVAAERGEMIKTLAAGLGDFRQEKKTFANHVREGQQQGVFWETVLPVTDPMERQARERGRRRQKGPPND